MEAVMKSRDHRIGAVLAGAILLLLTMPSASLAQKARSKAVSKTTAVASYKYAYEHGYREGYEDGFGNGKTAVGTRQERDFQHNDSYNRADRTYQPRMGTQIEYQEGYRYGFELGYGDGYFGRSYTTAIPGNLGMVVTANINASQAAGRPVVGSVAADERRQPVVGDERRQAEAQQPQPPSQEQQPAVGERTRAREVSVPGDVRMKIRLDSRISTKDNREGDQFTATVLDPSGYADAQVLGHIAKLKRSGSATGKTELSLAFDEIRFSDGRLLPLDAQVEKVYESESVKTVDDEGNVETSNRTKDTTVRTGGGAALGAIIGAIAGGGKGAAIGAIIGAGVGAGSVYVEGGKVLTLEPGTEMLIRTAAAERPSLSREKN